MADEDARLRAVEAEEARLAQRLERSDGPKVGSTKVERLRLLSVIAEVALDLDPDLADDLAVALLDAGWDYETSRRAVEVYGAKDATVYRQDDVLATAAALAEASRIAQVRRNAESGDPEAQVELRRIREALRRGVT